MWRWVLFCETLYCYYSLLFPVCEYHPVCLYHAYAVTAAAHCHNVSVPVLVVCVTSFLFWFESYSAGIREIKRW